MTMSPGPEARLMRPAQLPHRNIHLIGFRHDRRSSEKSLSGFDAGMDFASVHQPFGGGEGVLTASFATAPPFRAGYDRVTMVRCKMTRTSSAWRLVLVF